MATSIKEKQKIIADYIDNQNYSETARMNGVSVNTVKNIVLADNEIADKCKQKKQEHTQSTLDYMQQQHEAKKRILDKLLRGMELKTDDLDNISKMNIKDMATAYGIILDKELKVLELNKNSETTEEINKINKHIEDIAYLINNPTENRTEETMENKKE